MSEVIQMAARELGMSLATAERLWSFARVWLLREMEKGRDVPLNRRKCFEGITPLASHE
jgi:hypothetical protein